MQAQDIRLALDIGTRKVLGLAFEPTATGVKVVQAIRQEHTGRAMRDGQIHDVPAVAQVLRQVAAALEKQTGHRFGGAYVAAAGRALYTSRGGAEHHGAEYREIKADLVRDLEWEAVADAQASLRNVPLAATAQGGYYCVGHSVVRWWLDEALIGNPEGQWGRALAVEVLATFLPRAVVDALEAALSHAGLEMEGLTLEPIAALEAVVPPTMRDLNLALVDIGAGTSDIALTREGTVQAYAMVPRAGDSVTEALARSMLLDFGVAEVAKRKAAGGAKVKVADVLGGTREVGPESLWQEIESTVDELARQVAETIRQANGGKSPEAVLLVGGGSMTPGLPAALAKLLEVPPERIALRNRQAIPNVSGAKALKGPDVATPFGIALMAVRTGRLPLIRVQVGDRRVRLFQLERCTVGEALRAAGVPRATLVGRAGRGMTVTVNGKVRSFPGQRAVPGQVWLNGEPAELDTPCPDRSKVTWEAGKDGAPARLSLGDLVTDDLWLTLELNGRQHRVPPLTLVNGAAAPLERPLADRDAVEIRPCEQIGDLAQVLGPAGPGQSHLQVEVNGQAVAVPVAYALTVDGQPGDAATTLRPGSRVAWTRPVLSLGDAVRAAGLAVPEGMTVLVNGRAVLLQPPVRYRLNGAQAELDAPISEDDAVEVELPQHWQPLLHEVLTQVERPRSMDGMLVLRINGEPAGFTTPLSPGAEVEVRWQSAADGQH